MMEDNGEKELEMLMKNMSLLEKNINGAIAYHNKQIAQQATPEEQEIAKKFVEKHHQLIQEGKTKEAEELRKQFEQEYGK